MTSQHLRNLLKIGKLKAEPSSRAEFDQLLASAGNRLEDADHPALSLESRFTLACDASHSAALAALRANGYRSNSRSPVFQCLSHTVGWSPEKWRLFDVCHHKRSLAQYEGSVDVNDVFVGELIALTGELIETVGQLRALIAAE
jgi:hypothetical protein